MLRVHTITVALQCKLILVKTMFTLHKLVKTNKLYQGMWPSGYYNRI